MSDDKWITLLTAVEKNTFLDYFKKVDADNKGIVLQDEALQFLRKANIPENILMQFWTAVDNDRKGFLTEQEFCMILKLIACAQHGVMIGEPILSTKSPLPEFNGNTNSNSSTTQTPQYQQQQSALKTAAITPESRLKYINLFQSFKPINNTLSGDMARDIFMRSKLSPAILQRVWDLADTRRTGSLNQTEFIIAMHYIEMAMKEGNANRLPTALPAEVYASASGRGSSNQSPPAQSFIPVTSPLVRNNTMLQNSGPAPIAGSSPIFKGATASANLSITAEEYNKYHTLFEQLDTDKTGYVAGADAVVFFRHSKLSEVDLARIWDLADTDSSGKLSEKEFALAMHLINRKIAGVELPQSVSTSNFDSIFQTSTKDQQAQPNVDLLGLSHDASNTSLPYINIQESSNQTIAELQRTHSLLRNDVDRETMRLKNAQQNLSHESKQVQELLQLIEKEKEELAKVKQEADEAERLLEDEKRRKEGLAKELQTYRQEVNHYTSHLDDTKEKLKDEQQSRPQQPQQQQPASDQNEHANMFSLSSTVSSHNTGNQLFAKVNDEHQNDTERQPQALSHLTAAISPTLKHRYTGNSAQSQQSPLQHNRSLDPFAGTHKESSSPTVSMNKLKELKNASSVNNPALTTDLNDIESKFPDLTTMEQNFAAVASTSPNSISSQPPPTAASTSFVGENSAAPPAKSNNKITTSPAVKSSSKFDLLSAFDPSASTPFGNVQSSSSSVQEELSSIFSPKMAAVETAKAQQEPQTAAKQSESSNTFDNIFRSDSNNDSNARAPTSFEDAFLNK